MTPERACDSAPISPALGAAARLSTGRAPTAGVSWRFPGGGNGAIASNSLHSGTERQP